MTLGLVAVGAVGGWVWWRARDPARYSKRVFRVFCVTAAIASFAFVQHLGVFSPATTAVVLGLSFFCGADDGKVIMGASLSVAFAYFLSATAITLGLLPDVGVFASSASRDARLAILGLVTAIMLAQLWQARLSHRATREAMERALQTAMIASAREAQLVEARENLDAAIRAGAGREGKWTGATFGQYVLGDIVGRGAMGEVYAARVEPEGERAAVKLLRFARSDEPELVRRFLREAEIALRMRGPNLVDVRAVGTAPDGSPFIAMELLEGSDLATILRDQNTLPLDEAVSLVSDVARGLEVLHGAGVVHRDLKPQNLFRSAGPPTVWKILDYGVSKTVDGAATLTEALVGTPGYMSPEQARGRAVDPRSDVFALGSVAYRVLTGQRPFTGSDTPQLLYHVVYAAPIRPRELVMALPRDVELVLALALAKKPDDRFPSAAAFASALEAAASGKLEPSTRAEAERLLRAAPWRMAATNPQSAAAVTIRPPRTPLA